MVKRVVVALGILIFVLPALLGHLLAAQESQETEETTTASGVVRTAEGVPVAGAALRLIETSTGRAWVSWTSENGTFSLPGLPPGHYSIEVAQLGFEPATKEF